MLKLLIAISFFLALFPIGVVGTASGLVYKTLVAGFINGFKIYDYFLEILLMRPREYDVV